MEMNVAKTVIPLSLDDVSLEKVSKPILFTNLSLKRIKAFPNCPSDSSISANSSAFPTLCQRT